MVLDIGKKTRLETISRNAHVFFSKISLGKKEGGEHVNQALSSAIKDCPQIADLLTLIDLKNNQSAGFLKKSKFDFGIGADLVRKYQENAKASARRTPALMVPTDTMTIQTGFAQHSVQAAGTHLSG